jgi:precorrin-6B methylase 1
LVDPAKLQKAAPTRVVIAPPISSVRLIAERAGIIQELYGQHYGAYYHWGLNE